MLERLNAKRLLCKVFYEPSLVVFSEKNASPSLQVPLRV